jgi:hypothetical protein
MPGPGGQVQGVSPRVVAVLAGGKTGVAVVDIASGTIVRTATAQVTSARTCGPAARAGAVDWVECVEGEWVGAPPSLVLTLVDRP